MTVDLLRELEECFDNPMSIDEMVTNGLVRVVEEPAYSLSVLRGLEERYGYSTVDIFRLPPQELLFELPVSVIRTWLRNWDIYIKTGGNPEALKRSVPPDGHSRVWFERNGGQAVPHYYFLPTEAHAYSGTGVPKTRV
ncbi:MAG: hypothetical protein M1598_04740 [Actinobacteria bacterium]|nr:hypothetical protein [Actinomycetota bacterium]